MAQYLWTLPAVALYLGASALLVRRLVRRDDAIERLRIAAMAMATAAVALHALPLAHTLWTPNGLNLRFFSSASLIGWTMAVLLLVTSVRRPVENLGLAVFPVAAIALLASTLAGPLPGPGQPRGAGVDVHILLSVLAYSVLGLSAVQSLLLSAQEYQLRHRRPGGMIRMLPPLESMEQLLFDLLRIGFALLTLAIATGWAFLSDLFAQHLVHKTVLSVVAWLLFGTLIVGRHLRGWRGQTAARWTLGGFAVLALAVFGSKFVLELILNR